MWCPLECFLVFFNTFVILLVLLFVPLHDFVPHTQHEIVAMGAADILPKIEHLDEKATPLDEFIITGALTGHTASLAQVR